MRLLLDENLPHKLRFEIVGHDVATVAYMGWSGLDNGKLLAEAARSGFHAFITNDRGLEHEQHRNMLPLSVVILLAGSNTIEALRPLLPALATALYCLKPRTLVKVSDPASP